MPARTSKRYSWQRKRLRMLLLLLFPLVLLVGYMVHRANTAQQVRDAIAALEAAGAPVTLDALLEAQPAVPKEENAAVLIQALLAQLTPLSPEELRELPIHPNTPFDITAPYPEAVLRRLTAFTQFNRRRIQDLREAAKRPESVYALEPDHFTLRLPHAEHWPTLEAIEAANVRASAEAGSGLHVGLSLISVLALGESLREAPVMSLQNMRFQSIRMFKHSLERALNRIEVPPRQLEQLLERVRQIDLGHGLELGLNGYRASVIAFLPQIEDRPFMQWSGVLDRNMLVYLEMMERGLEAARRTPREGSEAWQRVLNQYNRRAGFLGMDEQRHVHRVFADWPVLTTQLAVIETTLAVELHRARTGALPERLQDIDPEILPEVPPDLYTGGLIQFHVLDGGYTVFSVGPEVAQDPVLPQRPGAVSPADIVLKVLRPAPPQS